MVYCFSGKMSCAYPHFYCSRPCLGHYKYCARHILEDKYAPFVQCDFVNSSNKLRCFKPAPQNGKKERYCDEHSVVMLAEKCHLDQKMEPQESVLTLLEQLSHHQIDPLNQNESDPSCYPSIASNVLQYDCLTSSDSDSSSDISCHPRLEDDSDLESLGSDSDVLDRAGVYTLQEVSHMYISKMKKLKEAYLGEMKHLMLLLKENRRKYLKNIKKEKETMVSIHSQAKDSAKDCDVYRCLKSMVHHNVHLGKDALFYHQYIQKRKQVTDGIGPKHGLTLPTHTRCTFSEGSWKCGQQTVPLTKYCPKHILKDKSQILYQKCGVVQGDSEPCQTPFIPLPDSISCIYHTSFPSQLPVKSPSHVKAIPPDFPYPENVIELSNSNAFVISELPPNQVMEGDSEEGTVVEPASEVEFTQDSEKTDPVGTSMDVDQFYGLKRKGDKAYLDSSISGEPTDQVSVADKFDSSHPSESPLKELDTSKESAGGESDIIEVIL